MERYGTEETNEYTDETIWGTLVDGIVELLSVDREKLRFISSKYSLMDQILVNYGGQYEIKSGTTGDFTFVEIHLDHESGHEAFRIKALGLINRLIKHKSVNVFHMQWDNTNEGSGKACLITLIHPDLQ